MNTFKVSELKDGMMFDQPVYVDGENLLVPPNVPIKQKDIDRLIKWDIEEINTEGEIIPNEEGDAAGRSGYASKEQSNLMKVLDAQADKELLDLYFNSVKVVDSVYKSIKENEPVENEGVDRVVNDLIPAIKDRKDEMISFLILSGHGEAPLAESSVNTTIISVFIAQAFKMTSHRINQLAFGALLHDIGMMKIPDQLLQKSGKLTDNELKVIQTHPIYSYKIITKTLRYPEEIGNIALQHHERWDGNGYPNQLKGEDISLSARIVSVADAFEAMVSVRPYRNSMIGYKAMRQLLNDNSRRFDSRVLKTFIKIMGIYPIGSIVLLNDASIGRVISTHSNAPLRPTVRLLIDSRGRTLEKKKEIIDLMHDKKLFIARAINPSELEVEK
jgi:HD-GYP domain-containing protein (c-di-GMP phosphodiesterase class II)